MLCIAVPRTAGPPVGLVVAGENSVDPAGGVPPNSKLGSVMDLQYVTSSAGKQNCAAHEVVKSTMIGGCLGTKVVRFLKGKVASFWSPFASVAWKSEVSVKISPLIVREGSTNGMSLRGQERLCHLSPPYLAWQSSLLCPWHAQHRSLCGKRGVLGCQKPGPPHLRQAPIQVMPTTALQRGPLSRLPHATLECTIVTTVGRQKRNFPTPQSSTAVDCRVVPRG